MPQTLSCENTGDREGTIFEGQGEVATSVSSTGTEFTASAQRLHLTRNMNSDSNHSLQASFYGETELRKEPFSYTIKL